MCLTSREARMVLRDVRGPLDVERLTSSPHKLTVADTVLGRRRIGYGVAVYWSILFGKRPHAWPGKGCRVTQPGGLVQWQPAEKARSLLNAHSAYRWDYISEGCSWPKTESNMDRLRPHQGGERNLYSLAEWYGGAGELLRACPMLVVLRRRAAVRLPQSFGHATVWRGRRLAVAGLYGPWLAPSANNRSAVVVKWLVARPVRMTSNPGASTNVIYI